MCAAEVIVAMYCDANAAQLESLLTVDPAQFTDYEPVTTWQPSYAAYYKEAVEMLQSVWSDTIALCKKSEIVPCLIQGANDRKEIGREWDAVCTGRMSDAQWEKTCVEERMCTHFLCEYAQ